MSPNLLTKPSELLCPQPHTFAIAVPLNHKTKPDIAFLSRLPESCHPAAVGHPNLNCVPVAVLAAPMPLQWTAALSRCQLRTAYKPQATPSVCEQRARSSSQPVHCHANQHAKPDWTHLQPKLQRRLACSWTLRLASGSCAAARARARMNAARAASVRTTSALFTANDVLSDTNHVRGT